MNAAFTEARSDRLGSKTVTSPEVDSGVLDFFDVAHGDMEDVAVQLVVKAIKANQTNKLPLCLTRCDRVLYRSHSRNCRDGCLPADKG